MRPVCRAPKTRIRSDPQKRPRVPNLTWKIMSDTFEDCSGFVRTRGRAARTLRVKKGTKTGSHPLPSENSSTTVLYLDPLAAVAVCALPPASGREGA